MRQRQLDDRCDAGMLVAFELHLPDELADGFVAPHTTGDEREVPAGGRFDEIKVKVERPGVGRFAIQAGWPVLLVVVVELFALGKPFARRALDVLDQFAVDEFDSSLTCVDSLQLGAERQFGPVFPDNIPILPELQPLTRQ